MNPTPNAPTLSMANDGTGTSATATLAGDVGATHQLFYQATGTSAWIAGASRSGNGGVDQTGLVAGQLYYFAAVSQIGGVLSLPSPIFALAVQTAVTVVGQTDALALAVVSWLTDNADAFCIPIVAERRFRLISELSEIPAANAYASVDVFPDMETNDRLGIAPAFTSLYTIHIFIQQQVGGSPGPEAQCALLTQLRSQILAGLKPLLFNLADAVQPVQNVFLSQARSADKGLYNLGRLLELNVYESDTILTFKAAV